MIAFAMRAGMMPPCRLRAVAFVDMNRRMYAARSDASHVAS